MSLQKLTFAAFAGLGFVVLFGCGSQSSLDAGTACGKDSDCPSGQTCRMPKTPGQKPQVAYNPCMMLAPCTDSAQCGPSLVCGPYRGATSPAFPTCPSMVCQAPCQEGSCPTDQVCADDGVCRFRPCDEQGAPACADHFRCDPAAAAALGSNPGSPQGSSVVTSADPARELARGCVRKLCNEDGGFVCRDLWSCDPPNAMQEPSGCTPDPCAESGQCESDYYICKPTSDGPRPTGMDVHGCVARNCEEGAECVYMPGTTNYSHCAVGAAGADTYGCVITQCDEEPGCNMGYLCDPGSQGADPRGCRYGRCDEAGANPCPQSYVCDPSSPLAGSNGCRSEPVSTGGTGGGGAGGGAGVGGIGVGGSGAIGPVGGSGGTAARGGGGGSGGSSGSSTGGSGASGGSGAVGAGGTAASAGNADGEMTGTCIAG